MPSSSPFAMQASDRPFHTEAFTKNISLVHHDVPDGANVVLGQRAGRLSVVSHVRVEKIVYSGGSTRVAHESFAPGITEHAHEGNETESKPRQTRFATITFSALMNAAVQREGYSRFTIRYRRTVKFQYVRLGVRSFFIAHVCFSTAARVVKKNVCHAPEGSRPDLSGHTSLASRCLARCVSPPNLLPLHYMRHLSSPLQCR